MMKTHIQRDPKRLDSFFYADQKIAEREYDGCLFYAYGLGDIRISIPNDEEITCNNISDYSHLTDSDLGNDEWEWHNNNWFEISASKDGQFKDLSVIADNYDHAIEMLNDDEFIKEQLKWINRNE